MVENASTSSPGLAFLLATIAAKGESGWQRLLDRAAAQRCARRRRLDRRRTRPTSPRAAASGDRPIVVSYGSDPAADVDRFEPAPRHAERRRRSRRRASGRWSSRACCTARTTSPGAQALVDFMLTRAVPGGHAAADVREPDRHRRDAARPCSRSGRSIPPHPYSIDPATISAKRSDWIKEWTDLVVRLMRARTRGARRAGRGPGRRSSRCSSRGRSWRSSRTRCGRARSPTSSPIPSLRRVAWFTLWQAVVSTRADARRRACPAAYVVARFDFPGPAAVPRVRHGAVRAADGRGRDRVPGAAAPGRSARVPALAARASRRCWSRTCSSTSRSWCAPSAGSGRTSIRGARKRRACSARRGRGRSVGVTLPLLAPSIIAAASIVFLFTFTSFGVALLLADPAHATLEVEIYRQADRAASTCGPRPRSRSCRSSRCSRWCSRSARAQERRGGRATAGRRGRLGPPAARPGEGRRRRRSSARRPCSSVGRSSCWSGDRCTSAGTGASARTARSGSSASTSDAVRLAVGGGAQLDRVRGDRHRDRARRRRAGVGRDRGAARAGRRGRWTRS